MSKKNKKAVENQTSKENTPWSETHADMCNDLPSTILGDDLALVTENMEAILRSPSHSLAQDDRALLERTEMRGVRMLLELGKPELAFQEDNIESTVIVFGGTQIIERNAAERHLSEALRNQAMDAENLKLARDVQRSERLVELSHFYDDARQFARLVSLDNQCDKKDPMLSSPAEAPVLWRPQIEALSMLDANLLGSTSSCLENNNRTLLSLQSFAFSLNILLYENFILFFDL